MKAIELSDVLEAFLPLLGPGRTRDGVRFLSSALRQLPASRRAADALSTLDAALEAAPDALGDAPRFADLAPISGALLAFAEAGGSAGAKAAAGALTALVNNRGHRGVRQSEDLLAPPPAAAATDVPRMEIVEQFVLRLNSCREGTTEFAAMLEELAASPARAPELREIARARGLKVTQSTKKPGLMKKIRANHDIIVETRTKIAGAT
jgi:hypothetical protein